MRERGVGGDERARVGKEACHREKNNKKLVLKEREREREGKI